MLFEFYNKQKQNNNNSNSQSTGGGGGLQYPRSLNIFKKLRKSFYIILVIGLLLVVIYQLLINYVLVVNRLQLKNNNINQNKGGENHVSVLPIAELTIEVTSLGGKAVYEKVGDHLALPIQYTINQHNNNNNNKNNNNNNQNLKEIGLSSKIKPKTFLNAPIFSFLFDFLPSFSSQQINQGSAAIVAGVKDLSDILSATSGHGFVPKQQPTIERNEL
ncbi:hypothetical protein DFA_05979 [Cavenderia fasciculata]|uniref:Uncharacterized protein n=1 Tax=Cavenderia fasciculata TaxID=261658 RepID=F4PJR9_CACFS|nr:uncharacterized protein DFA_05979 [Cavenderia fasciculata]EGG23843.1 hypothetical protein DFA_05979 [Cavenderia fasciculata]|eukprot:XP_004361694.1 hypothetical protein DFA_05979 [Cavenderia fasciculata]